jgi:D-threo-aldose 1-dehydrogenase
VGDFDICLIAGRYTLLDQDALTSLLPLCAEKGIGVVAGGPFNTGILATGVKADSHYDYGEPPNSVRERVRHIQRICKAFKVKLAGAALRFPLGHPAIVSVIPGAQRASEAKRNADMMSAKIPPGFWRTLKDEKLIRADAPVPR